MTEGAHRIIIAIDGPAASGKSSTARAVAASTSPIAVATYSAVTNRAMPEGTAVVGEVGLAGELRSVSQLARRQQEAHRAGHGRLIGPRAGIQRAGPAPAGARTGGGDDGYATLKDALAAIWSAS